MCFDWRSGFSAATGSIIMTVQDVTDIVQQDPVLSQIVRWETLCGVSLAVVLSLIRIPRPRRPLPHWVHLCVDGVCLPVLESVRRLNREYIRIFPENIRRMVRIYGGFFATYSLIIIQAINVYRWRYQGVETVALWIQVGYISTVILDVIFLEARRCELESRDYLVRTFLTIMNFVGLFISFDPEMWERIYYLFIPLSLTVLSMRNFDMQDPPNFVNDERREDVPPALPDGANVRIPNGVPPRQVIPPVVAAPEDDNLEDNENSDDENDENN